jgi:uncharacterized protein
MISIREEIAIASPPDAVWPILSDPATVASCIPGASLSPSGTKAGEGGKYQGTMRVKFGPTVAQFRGEATLAYDHAARRCTIEGRGIDGRGASRANASGIAEVSGTDATLLKVEGNFTVTGPLETFANAGGVHIARAILAEFADNVAKLVGEQASQTASHPGPLPASGERERVETPRPVYGEREGPAAQPWEGEGQPRAMPRLAAAELSGGKILWRAFRSWLRQVFSGKREAR